MGYHCFVWRSGYLLFSVVEHFLWVFRFGLYESGFQNSCVPAEGMTWQEIGHIRYESKYI